MNKKPVKSSLISEDDSMKFEEFAEDFLGAILDLAEEKMKQYGADINDVASALERLEPSDPNGYLSMIGSSLQGQERGIQAIMDEYGCTREEAIEIMNQDITSGCHGKAKKKAEEKEKKEIKSTWNVEDETDVWTEDDEERLRGEFADERGLNLNEDEFPEDDYNEWVHRGAVMYSSVNRNHRNIQALYSSTKKQSIKSTIGPIGTDYEPDITVFSNTPIDCMNKKISSIHFIAQGEEYELGFDYGVDSVREVALFAPDKDYPIVIDESNYTYPLYQTLEEYIRGLEPSDISEVDVIKY